jgi:exopolyphosphatase/guanosine-5'-triphosphate,3'-diphosphate pyrophosphatase
MQLIGRAQAKVVLAPQVNLWDAVMRLILVPRRSREYDEYIRRNAVSCANHIADDYACDRTHIETVRKISCTIFDRLKPLYGMDSAQRLMLELAAILHESGHYVSENDHLPSSFDIIRHTDIYGVTNRDILLAAYVARYNEDAVPDFRGLEYVSMTEAERTVIAKLVAIFRLANALDKSRKQKIRSVKVQLLGDQMFVAAQSNANLFLEKWAFEQCSTYFKEVFGLYPVLKIKQDLI